MYGNGGIDMDFFDTLGVKTKALGDSARLNVKISDENHKAADYKRRLGELVWKKYENGLSFDDADILGLLLQIKAFYTNIDRMNAELEQIKARCAESERAAEAEKTENAKKRKAVCPKCGAEISPGQRFCAFCGAALFNGAPVEKRCAGCGCILSDEQEFCPQCGRKYQ